MTLKSRLTIFTVFFNIKTFMFKLFKSLKTLRFFKCFGKKVSYSDDIFSYDDIFYQKYIHYTFYF